MQQTQVKLIAAEAVPPKFILLEPGSYPARTGRDFQLLGDWSDIPWVTESASKSDILVLDLETNGLDYSTGQVSIIGLGLAWDTGSIYFPFTNLSFPFQDKLLALIYSHPKLIAHNIYFDGGVLYSHTGQHPNWHVCTYALYRHLATEGWDGQSWSLKRAMQDLLCWPSSNELELDNWLVENGHEKAPGRPDKSKMWLAPQHILGKYCVLDCEATYLLYTKILAPHLGAFAHLGSYEKQFTELIKLHIEQKCLGIEMDIPGLEEKLHQLSTHIGELHEKFTSHPGLIGPIREMEAEMLDTLKRAEPAEFKKARVRPLEPEKYTKSGNLSKRWQEWVRNAEKYEPQVSKNWLNWKDKYNRAASGSDPDYRLNLNSRDQMAELLYTRMCMPVEMLTETGLPSTSISAYQKMGELAAPLVEMAYAVKQQGFVVGYLEDMDRNGRSTLHPDFRMPGTLTGRLSSANPNFQQIPKTKSMMQLFKAREGHVWVDLDFAALEAIVVTEFSRDENMLHIYGDNAPANDIHLFIAAHVPGLREAVLSTGYDPYAPTPESLAKAKRECKAQRNIAKTVVYASQYGAGTDKIHKVLVDDGVRVSWDQVDAVRNTYWDLFSGLRKFQWELEREWRTNGGWILNGVGRPLTISEEYRKDILNRFIQSTGHDILTKYTLGHVVPLLNERQIPWRPILIDLHDALTIEVPKVHATETAEILKWAMHDLNNELQGLVKLRGKPTIGINLAQVKEPEEE